MPKGKAVQKKPMSPLEQQKDRMQTAITQLKSTDPKIGGYADEIQKTFDDLMSIVKTEWTRQIVGMRVSMDVSTCDDDHGNRIFGKVDHVMPGSNEDTIIVIEDNRNF